MQFSICFVNEKYCRCSVVPWIVMCVLSLIKACTTQFTLLVDDDKVMRPPPAAFFWTLQCFFISVLFSICAHLRVFKCCLLTLSVPEKVNLKCIWKNGQKGLQTISLRFTVLYWKMCVTHFLLIILYSSFRCSWDSCDAIRISANLIAMFFFRFEHTHTKLHTYGLKHVNNWTF